MAAPTAVPNNIVRHSLPAFQPSFRLKMKTTIKTNVLKEVFVGLVDLAHVPSILLEKSRFSP
jgi:hypothetical protein